MSETLAIVLETAVTEFGEEVKKSLEDGKITIMETVGFVSSLTEKCMKVARVVPDATGAQKKEAVRTAVISLWDKVLRPMDLPGPDAVIDRLVDMFLPVVLDFIIDDKFKIFEMVGWE